MLAFQVFIYLVRHYSGSQSFHMLWSVEPLCFVQLQSQSALRLKFKNWSAWYIGVNERSLMQFFGRIHHSTVRTVIFYVVADRHWFLPVTWWERTSLERYTTLIVNSFLSSLWLPIPVSNCMTERLIRYRTNGLTVNFGTLIYELPLSTFGNQSFLLSATFIQ